MLPHPRSRLEARGSAVLHFGRVKPIPAALLPIAVFLALGSGWAWAGRQPAVPLQIQKRLANLYPREMAFVPGRLPTDDLYVRWFPLHSIRNTRWTSYYGYEIFFHKKHLSAGVEFVVARRSCSWRAQGHFRINGHKISWRRTYDDSGDIIDEFAWRCMRTVRGQPFVLVGMGGGLRGDAYVVAYAKPAR